MEISVPMRIDFDLLKKQKRILLNMADKAQKSPDFTQDDADTIEGMILILDAIGDHAVDKLGMKESDVFDLTEE